MTRPVTHLGRRAVAVFATILVAEAAVAVPLASAHVLAAPDETVRPKAAVAPYTAGGANASAQPFGVALVYHSLQLGFGLANSTASYLGGSATATGTVLDSGLLGVASDLELCGKEPFPPNATPQPVVANSDAGGGKPVTKSTSKGTGPNLAAITVSAAPGPNATTRATGLGFDFAGLVDVSGGVSGASVSSNGKTRVRHAAASSTVASLTIANGLITLRGMQWKVSQTVSGVDSRRDRRSHTASFRPGTIQVGHLPAIKLPANPSALQDALNKITAPLGVQITPPAVTRQDGGYVVTPLVVSIGGKSAIFAPLVAKLASSTLVGKLETLLTSALFDSKDCDELGGILKSDPQLNSTYNALGVTAPLALAAVVSAFSGGGAIKVNIGGASSSVNDTYYKPPFGASGPGGSSPPPPGTTRPAGGSVGSSLPGGNSSQLPGPTNGPGPAVASQPSAASFSTRCITTSPASTPSCWRGRAVAGGLGAAFVAIAVLAVDEQRRRRRRLHRLLTGGKAAA